MRALFNGLVTGLVVAWVVVSLTQFPSLAYAGANCQSLFDPAGVKDKPFLIRESKISRALASSLAASLEKSQDLNARYGKKARGYVVISAAMVTSAAISSKLVTGLPPDMAFLSSLVGQVSTIGLYVLGAPIWEPISSAFRKFAFGLGAKDSAKNASDPALETLWQRTQSNYSLNAQMARNVIQTFLIAAHGNFNEARRAIQSGERDLAADQIAETAIRLRNLFSDIDPRDPSIALAVKSTFTRHVEDPGSIKNHVIERIRLGDRQYDDVEAVRAYYELLLQTWL